MTRLRVSTMTAILYAVFCQINSSEKVPDFFNRCGALHPDEPVKDKDSAVSSLDIISGDLKSYMRSQIANTYGNIGIHEITVSFMKTRIGKCIFEEQKGVIGSGIKYATLISERREILNKIISYIDLKVEWQSEPYWIRLKELHQGFNVTSCYLAYAYYAYVHFNQNDILRIDDTVQNNEEVSLLDVQQAAQAVQNIQSLVNVPHIESVEPLSANELAPMESQKRKKDHKKSKRELHTKRREDDFTPGEIQAIHGLVGLRSMA